MEGAGDASAVPRLIRETYAKNGIYDVNPAPKPKMNTEIRKLNRAGELERYVRYALSDSGDSVLVALDCDDLCPSDVLEQFCLRIKAIKPSKKVGVVLFRSEFETMFLHCIDEISTYYPDYGWNVNLLGRRSDVEKIRGAKEMLSRMMKIDRGYKETRDQEKFITAINYDKLRSNSSSFHHFERALLWLAQGSAPIHPYHSPD